MQVPITPDASPGGLAGLVMELSGYITTE